jgi:hypothetical protein
MKESFTRIITIILNPKVLWQVGNLIAPVVELDIIKEAPVMAKKSK